jgi:hypothetical protein
VADILQLVDLEALRLEVREKYREVAEDPTAEYHFHTGRAQAIRLGYPSSPLDQLPEEACEAFAGVANPFYWGGPQPGERVVDLGSGAGMDSFLAALWVRPHWSRDRRRHDTGDAPAQPRPGGQAGPCQP